MTRVIFFVLALLLIGCWPPAFGQEETEAAQAKTLDQLVADRKGVSETMDGLKKNWEKNEAEFRKTKPFMEHDAKQKQIQQTYLEVAKRLKALDTQIVERVSKDHKVSKP